MADVERDQDLVRRIEAAEIAFLAESIGAATSRRELRGAFVTPVADGVGLFSEPGSPLNKVLGLGLTPGSDAGRALDALRGGAAAGLPVELSDAASPELADALRAAGYRASAREVVLVLDPRDFDVPAADGVTVERVPSREPDTWVDVSVDGFAYPAEGTAHADFGRAILRQVFTDRADVPETFAFLARIGREAVGAGGVRLDGDLALMCGAATLPAYRRRGVQATMLGARLVFARDAECTLAVVTAPEGSASERNVRRVGFETAHVRTIFELPTDRSSRAPHEIGRTP